MAILKTLPTPSVQRPYVTPALVVHGDVQTLTLGKNGPNPDLDGTGSFTPPNAGDAAPSGQ